MCDGPNAALHTLAGAYVLDALSDAGRIAFARHLTRCEVCAQEIVDLRETAAWLASPAPPPPPALKTAVLTRIGQVRQVAPTGEAPE